jgi:hypothetical protein
MVGRHPAVEARLLGVLSEAQQAIRRDLLVGAVECDEGHVSFLPMAHRVRTAQVPQASVVVAAPNQTAGP